MSREVSFSFDSPEEKQEYLYYAKSKGMTLSALVKMALYQYRAKYPCKSKKRNEWEKVDKVDEIEVEAEKRVDFKTHGQIPTGMRSKTHKRNNCTALTAYGTTGGGLDPETQSTQEEGANDKV